MLYAFRCSPNTPHATGNRASEVRLAGRAARRRSCPQSPAIGARRPRDCSGGRSGRSSFQCGRCGRRSEHAGDPARSARNRTAADRTDGLGAPPPVRRQFRTTACSGGLVRRSRNLGTGHERRPGQGTDSLEAPVIGEWIGERQRYSTQESRPWQTRPLARRTQARRSGTRRAARPTPRSAPPCRHSHCPRATPVPTFWRCC